MDDHMKLIGNCRHLQTFSCSSARISSSMKKATLMIFLYISMKKPLLEVGKFEGMFVKSCWWLSGDSIEIQYSIRSRLKYQDILRSVDNAWWIDSVSIPFENSNGSPLGESRWCCIKTTPSALEAFMWKKNLIQGTSMHQQKVEMACFFIWISVIDFVTNNSKHRRTTGEVKKADLRPSWTLSERHGACLRHGKFFSKLDRWNPVCCSS